MSGKASLLTELRRRNVLRAAAFYAAAAWLLVQVATQVFPFYDVPAWAVRWVIAALAIGFPLWVAFAWFHEWTPQGLKRESDIDPADSVTPRTGRRLDFWIIAILAVAVVLLLTYQFVSRGDAGSVAAMSTAAAAPIPGKSIAVLPLANESGDPEQAYFSDGLSEELIADLTQIDTLKVIGKSSSFQFRDSRDSPAQIAATLGVAHLLEGSVRRQGNRLRIVIGLIKAADASSIWSHTYDRELKDVFAVQSEIGQAVAAALKIKLLGKTIVSEEKPTSGNVEAYRLMLQGRALARQRKEAAYREGLAMLDEAVRIDPGYAYAWGLLSNYRINLGAVYLEGAPRERAYADARTAAAREAELAPDSASTHVDRGYLLSMLDLDVMGALAEYRRAYALAPNDGTSTGFLALQLSIVGERQAAVDLFHKAIAVDPLRIDRYISLSLVLVTQGRLDEAERTLRSALKLHADFPVLYSQLASIDLLRGDTAAARRNAEQESDAQSKAWALAAVSQLDGDRAQADAALRDFLASHAGEDPISIADLHALRRQPDAIFEWLDRAWQQRDWGITQLLGDPFLAPYRRDPRFVALCREVGLPVHAPGDPSGEIPQAPPSASPVPATGNAS